MLYIKKLRAVAAELSMCVETASIPVAFCKLNTHAVADLRIGHL